MKKLLLTSLLVCGFVASSLAQTTINPDTVCANAVGEQYFVTNTATSTYQWTITGGGGALQTGQGTNSVTVDWGAAGGLYLNAVEVTETDVSGCNGMNMLLDVYILSLQTNNVGPFCPGDPTTALVGTPVGGSWSGTGVVGSTFDPAIAGPGNYVLTYTMAGCNTTTVATVYPGPVTGPIQHY